jgi:hypothetical protein
VQAGGEAAGGSFDDRDSVRRERDRRPAVRNDDEISHGSPMLRGGDQVPML